MQEKIVEDAKRIEEVGILQNVLQNFENRLTYSQEVGGLKISYIFFGFVLFLFLTPKM